MEEMDEREYREFIEDEYYDDCFRGGFFCDGVINSIDGNLLLIEEELKEERRAEEMEIEGDTATILPTDPRIGLETVKKSGQQSLMRFVEDN